MDSKFCVICNTEKSFDKFYNNYRECKQCNKQPSMKCYYENKDKSSIQRQLKYERNRDVLLAKSRLNQQNRKYETKLYKQQIEELKKKLKL